MSDVKEVIATLKKSAMLLSGDSVDKSKCSDALSHIEDSIVALESRLKESVVTVDYGSYRYSIRFAFILNSIDTEAIERSMRQCFLKALIDFHGPVSELSLNMATIETLVEDILVKNKLDPTANYLSNKLAEMRNKTYGRK